MIGKYLDSIEIILGVIVLGMSTLLLALVGNWGLKLTVSNSSPAIACGWFLVLGCIGILIVLFTKYAALFQLVGKIAKKTVRILFSHEI